MDPPRRAKSILEFLTAENCSVCAEEPTNKGNTRNPNFHAPKQINVWKEFNFETLETLYNGKLMAELRYEDRKLPEYPTTSPASRIDCDESETTLILHHWSHYILDASLNAVVDTLHPSLWVSRLGKQNWATPLKNNWKPDAGAEAACGKDKRERLPKDYKVAKKWRSRVLHQKSLINSAGLWNRGSVKSNDAMPIRQAFTYCVTTGCRYGCILSTEEAFIFRIKPRTSPRDPLSEKALREAITTNGLMEYVSIPWQNHNVDESESKKLTVNLALFVVHILAGNSHRLDWTYPGLAEEELTPLPCSHDDSVKVAKTTSHSANVAKTNHRRVRQRPRRSLTPPSQDVEAIYSRKRKRTEEHDEAMFSTAGSFNFTNQIDDNELGTFDEDSQQAESQNTQVSFDSTTGLPKRRS